MAKENDIYKEMFMERTNRSMFDSGSVFKRWWEENQAVELDKTPEATIDKNGDVWLSTYHFLRETTTYIPALDQHFQTWMKQNNKWIGDFREYADTLSKNSNITVFDNTYNWETLLNQGMQFCIFYPEFSGLPQNIQDELDMAYARSPLLLVSVHQGADIRSGYGTPHAFVIEFDGSQSCMDEEYFINAMHKAVVECPKGHVRWYVQTPFWYKAKDNMPDRATSNICPVCGAELQVSARFRS